MLKKHNQIMVSLLFILDILLTSLALITAYVFRFSGTLIPITKGIPDYKEYLKIMPVILLISIVTYWLCGLYKPRREGMLREEWFDIAKATFIASFAFAAATFFYRTEYEYSRVTLGVFFFLNCLFLGFSRSTARLFLRYLRKRGWNLRHAFIVGSGKVAQSLADKLAKNPWTGVQVVGYVDDEKQRVGKRIGKLSVIDHIDRLPQLVSERDVDQVYIALPWSKLSSIEQVVQSLSKEIVNIRIVPDLLGLVTLHSSASVLDGLPILTLQDSPLSGWNFTIKRLVDIGVSLFFLIALFPLLLLIAIIVKLTSPGTIFYTQERMSLDGRTFLIYKFRTMVREAEKESGATWASIDDPRRTWIGAVLRKASLDELPQFFNVLKGDMSIVGPRPERPAFINDFKEDIPKYMLRHKIKAGITGWAQVNGWRGNTSLKKRLQYDLYYINNWSIWFDFQIMILTFFRGFFNKNAV